MPNYNPSTGTYTDPYGVLAESRKLGYKTWNPATSQWETADWSQYVAPEWAGGSLGDWTEQTMSGIWGAQQAQPELEQILKTQPGLGAYLASQVQPAWSTGPLAEAGWESLPYGQKAHAIHQWLRNQPVGEYGTQAQRAGITGGAEPLLGAEDITPWAEWMAGGGWREAGIPLTPLAAYGEGARFDVPGEVDVDKMRRAVTEFYFPYKAAAGEEAVATEVKKEEAEIAAEAMVTDEQLSDYMAEAMNLTGLGQPQFISSFGEFLSAKIPGTDITYGDYWGGVTPTDITREGILYEGDRPKPLEIQGLLREYITWYGEKQAIQDFADAEGVDVSQVILDEEGNPQLVEEPAAGVLGDEGVADVITQWFGEEGRKEMQEAIMGGVKTPTEIEQAFKDYWGPQERDWQYFGQPGAIATGTARAGGLGSGVEGEMSRRQAMYEASKVSAYQQYSDAATGQNIAYLSTALEYAKTPAEVANLYSQTGFNLANIELTMSQAAGIDNATWRDNVLLPYNIEKLERMMEGYDIDNMYKLLQIAAAEQGFDANMLIANMNMYMTNQAYGIDSPWMALIMALTDQDLLAAYGTAAS